MLKRTITSTVYALIIVGCFLLRKFVSYKLFYLLIWALNVICTLEFKKVLKGVVKSEVANQAVFLSFIITPLFVALEKWGKHPGIICLAVIFAFVIFITAMDTIKRTDVQYAIFDILPFIYPTALLLTMLMINSSADREKGFIVLVLVFAISCLSDVLAYLVGTTYNKIKKGKARKLFPTLSPKKTVAGGIGGLIGGVIAAVLVGLIFPCKEVIGERFGLVVLMVVGLTASVFNQMGDLFESFIKRRIGVKDMGNILPGHGGVLDRIDGTLFVSAYLYMIIYFIFI